MYFARTLIAAAATVLGLQAQAAPVVLTFEGLKNLESVSGFYNGGAGGNGSLGPNLGVEFVGGSLAVIDADAGGDGNFANEPTPDTILFFLTSTAVLNYAAGFDTGFSFFYTAINNPSSVTVYSGLNKTGDVLGTLALPVLPSTSGGGDPTGQFNNWGPVGVSFAGTARSIDFGGTANQVGFDNITFGSANPVVSVPEPSSYAMLFAGLLAVGWLQRRRA